MSKLIADSWRAIADAFSVPLILGLSLAIFLTATRAASFVWYLIQQRGRRPLVIRMGTGTGDAGRSAEHIALDGQLLAYLASDGQGDYVIAPGAGGRAAPGVAAEALEPTVGWPGALLRLALVREPSYLVDVTWPEAGNPVTKRDAVVRISRAPGDRIVRSGSFTGEGDEELVKIVGCFCIVFFRSQPRVLRRTPRWERWGQDINGYRAYRDGLAHQIRGTTTREMTRSLKDYRAALKYFHEAARIVPGNLLVQLHRAALLELAHRYERAVDIYEKCSTLWPGHIETDYRLRNARKNARNPVSHDELLNQLKDLRAQLKLSSLVMSWLFTFRPWRWNPGERRYWASWLQLRLPRRVTKRAAYRHAVKIGELIAELSRLLGTGATCRGPADITDLMELLAKEIRGNRGKGSSFARLLYPEQDHRIPGTMKHNHAFHKKSVSHVARIDPRYSRERRRNIGWLAHFNAACFFSLAMRLDKNQLPGSFSRADWQDDCARAAIREIGILVRDPRNALEPDWLGRDRDLEPLRESRIGKKWLRFVGLIPARGRK